jgi:hypothetical protein
MFKLYPILPWCFLMGILIGLGWGLARVYGPVIRESCRRKWQAERYETWDKWVFNPIGSMQWVNPAVT